LNNNVFSGTSSLHAPNKHALTCPLRSATARKSEQRLIRGVDDGISRGRIGVERPGIYRLIRVVMLVGVGGAIRGALRIIFCHKASSEMID
jgi:hypothetical protein